MRFSLSLIMSVFFLPAHFLSLSLCLTWLQKDIWFLFATEGLDDFNAKKRKAALNCDEISMSGKYEPLGHDLLVIANVFVCICSDWGLFKDSSFIAERVVVYESACVCVSVRERKRDVFLHRHKLVTGETMSLLQPVFIHTMHIFSSKGDLFSFSFPKISQYAFAMHILKYYCPQRKWSSCNIIHELSISFCTINVPVSDVQIYKLMTHEPSFTTEHERGFFDFHTQYAENSLTLKQLQKICLYICTIALLPTIFTCASTVALPINQMTFSYFLSLHFHAKIIL